MLDRPGFQEGGKGAMERMGRSHGSDSVQWMQERTVRRMPQRQGRPIGTQQDGSRFTVVDHMSAEGWQTQPIRSEVVLVHLRPPDKAAASFVRGEYSILSGECGVLCRFHVSQTPSALPAPSR
mmetsp:Transcript_37076/g.75071  ORF Transcript_37076/g.75071 Transcript_37076/m.75071 type:complete len:123 (+) Transcript_37076:429-797(+)